ncbi:Phytochrome-interacting ankyrin-repeat protein 1 [Bienertia sinuspersici]
MCRVNKPNEYYLTVFPERYDLDTMYGNIFHIAAHAEQEAIVREVIERKLLPIEVVHQLLCQPRTETDKDNPLHLAARFGFVEILKMLLNAFNSSSSSSLLPSHLPKPWLEKPLATRLCIKKRRNVHWKC